MASQLLSSLTSPGPGLFTASFVWPGGSPALEGQAVAVGSNAAQTAEAPYAILVPPQ